MFIRSRSARQYVAFECYYFGGAKGKERVEGKERGIVKIGGG